jgi:aminopeptidase YwaD
MWHGRVRHDVAMVEMVECEGGVMLVSVGPAKEMKEKKKKNKKEFEPDFPHSLANAGNVDPAIETLELTRAILEKCPRRPAGSAEALSAAALIRDHLGRYCDSVALEPFDIYPGQFWNIGRIFFLSYLAAALGLLFGAGGIIPALAAGLFGIIYGVVQFIIMGRLFDRLFKKESALNVVGVIEPKQEPTRQIIISGHHDSAYVSRFLLKHQELYGILMVAAVAAYFVGFALIVWTVLRHALTGSLPGDILWVQACVLALALPVLPLYFFIMDIPSPGAGDNLLGSAICITLAKQFAGEKLRHTRLILLSTDAEEIGQRGAQSFVQAHRQELHSLPTCTIAVDSIHKLCDLAVVTRDRNGLVALSRSLSDACVRSGAKLGYRLRKVFIPAGGGGTDASWFTSAGNHAVAIIGIPTNFIRRDLVYHTPYDTVDRIEPAAVKAVIAIVVDVVAAIDGQIS